LKLIYSNNFFNDLREIIKYYIQENISYKKIVFDIFKKIDFLKLFPRMGKEIIPTVDIGYSYRCIKSGRYLIFYEFDENSLCR